MHESLNAQRMRQALGALDEHLHQAVLLILGGGGAMVLAYDFPLSTADLDAVPKGIEIAELDKLTKKVAAQLGIAPDWLNPYYSTFAHTLPADYGDRLISVFKGKFLEVKALGKEDLLIMKCFAHRPKDVSHCLTLIKRGANIHQVQDHLELLQQQGIPGTQAASDFLDDVLNQTL